MSKKNDRTTRTPKAQVSNDTPAVVPTNNTTVSTVPAPARTLALRDVVAGLPEAFREPSWLTPMAETVVSIHAMPTKTREQRQAVVDAYVSAMSTATGITGIALEPTGKHTGRFTGMAVFETQNAIYLACAMANVAVDEGHVCAMWRGELPRAKCDYLGTAYDKAYPWSTLSLYVNGGHNGGPIPGAREAVTAWAKRGRKPVEPAK